MRFGFVGSMPPCNGCQDRKEGCHGKCQRYFEWKAECAEIRNKVQKERDMNPLLSTTLTRKRWKLIKKQSGKG